MGFVELDLLLFLEAKVQQQKVVAEKKLKEFDDGNNPG